MDAFEQLVARGDPLDLARGVALLATDEYPALDVDALLGQLDELAKPLLVRRLASVTASEQADALRVRLYEEAGYSGNETDYYDPKNSLLPDVLARRTGIPISLALVYTEVARRAGVKANGVAFPGHFLVRIDDAQDGFAFVDPFFGGKTMTDESLLALLQKVSGQAGQAPPTMVTPQMLEPATTRVVMLRWLMNLRGVYLQRADFARAMVVMHRILSLSPDDAPALRDRGLLAARLGAISQAKADLTRSIEVGKDPGLLAQTRSDLARLEKKRTSLN